MSIFTSITKRISALSRSQGSEQQQVISGDMGLWDMGQATTTAGGPSRGLGISTVYAVVDTVSRTFGALPTGLYKRETDGDLIPATGHYQYDLFTRSPFPEEYVTPYYGKRQLAIDYMLWGNGYQLVLIDDKGRNRAYVNLAPWEVIPFRSLDHRLYYQVYHPLYMGTYTPDRIIHLRDMGQGDLGLSKITLHAITIGKEKAAAKFINQSYTNGFFMGGVIEYPKESGELTPDQISSMRENFKKVYGGLEKGAGVGIITGGGVLKQFRSEMPLNNAQYVESARFNKVEICSIFNVPPPKIGYTEGTPYNSLESLNVDYWQNCILPLVTMYEQEINLKCFAGKERIEIRHNFDSILRADTAAMGEFYSKMFRIGAMNRDEIRERMDMNKIDGGQTYFIEGNNMIPAHLSEQLTLANIKSKDNAKVKDTTKSE